MRSHTPWPARGPAAGLLALGALALGAPGLPASQAAGATAPLATVVLVPRGSGRDVVVTFAHPFRKGEVRGGLRLDAAGRDLPTQVDAKRRYADGSLEHAVLSVGLARVEEGRSVKLDILPGSRPAASGAAIEGLPEGFSARVAFRFPDGTARRADAGAFLRRAMAGEAGFRRIEWLGGPLVREVRVAGPPLGAGGDPDPDLLVLFGLRVLRGGRAVRVEVVVENPWVDTPGNIPYDVEVEVGGRTVLAEERVGTWKGRMPYWLKGKDRNLGHFAGARWRALAWWGEAPPEVEVRHDPAYLVSTGLLPPYDTGLRLDPDAIDRTWKRWLASRRGILENGIIMAYFPTTGGREDLGPCPTWTARYLLSQDPRLWRVVLGTGDLAGSFPVHVRDRESGRILSIDAHPGFSLNPRGTLERIGPRPAADRPYVRPKTSPYAVDCAHQPSLAFVPYLLTGEHYYLEEMAFWANWCMISQNAAYREKERGLLLPDQVRGEAWALRQLVDAAKIAPDGEPEKAYFDAKVRENIAAYRRFIAGPGATPLGTYTLGASDAFVRGRPPAERRRWLTLAPWQQNFLVWSLDHAVRAGYEEAAAPRDYFARLQVGLLTHPEAYDPRYAAPYFLVVGEREDGRVRWYTRWDELFEKTFRVVAPDVKPGPEGVDYGSSYAHIARGVLLLVEKAGLPRAREARIALEGKLPRLGEVLAGDPTWAFAP